MENKYVVVNCCDVLSCVPVTTRLSLSSSPDLGVHVRVEENSKLTSKRLHTLGVNTARVRKSCDGFGVPRWTHYIHDSLRSPSGIPLESTMTSIVPKYKISKRDYSFNVQN